MAQPPHLDVGRLEVSPPVQQLLPPGAAARHREVQVRQLQLAQLLTHHLRGRTAQQAQREGSAANDPQFAQLVAHHLQASTAQQAQRRSSSIMP